MSRKPHRLRMFWLEKRKQDEAKELPSYSDVFLKAVATANTDSKSKRRHIQIKYKLVATHFGRYHLKETNRTRKVIVGYMLQFTVEEWRLVRDRMRYNITSSGGSQEWIKSRESWVDWLETLRAFEYPNEEMA